MKQFPEANKNSHTEEVLDVLEEMVHGGAVVNEFAVNKLVDASTGPAVYPPQTVPVRGYMGEALFNLATDCGDGQVIIAPAETIEGDCRIERTFEDEICAFHDRMDSDPRCKYYSVCAPAAKYSDVITG